MLRNLSPFVFIFSLLGAAPAAAQTAPAQFDQVVAVKAQATQSLNALLNPGQKQSIRAIALDLEGALRNSFGQPAAGVHGIFSAPQLAAIASALQSGSLPDVNGDQMSQVAQLMSGVIMKAAPAWQSHAAKVDALLLPSQRVQIDRLRAGTLRRLPHIAFMGMDLFSALGDGSQFGGFMTDPGSFALLLALPDTDALLNVAKRQAHQQSSPFSSSSGTP